MKIESFDDFLQVARTQALPQRLLLVFATAELPDDATPEQRAGFEAGHGGALVPSMCVDKSADDLASFESLSNEAAEYAPTWSLLFSGAMDVVAQGSDAVNAVDKELQAMVESVKQGDFTRCLAFNREGIPVAMA